MPEAAAAARDDDHRGLAGDLGAGTLAAFSLVVPNTTNDAHGGCLSCADAWLARWIPRIVASPAYQDGSTAVFVTYDSDDKSAKNHIATMVIAPSVKPGTVASGAYSHYSMLRTIEDMLGLPGTSAALRPRPACALRSTCRREAVTPPGADAGGLAARLATPRSSRSTCARRA